MRRLQVQGKDSYADYSSIQIVGIFNCPPVLCTNGSGNKLMSSFSTRIAEYLAIAIYQGESYQAAANNNKELLEEQVNKRAQATPGCTPSRPSCKSV